MTNQTIDRYITHKDGVKGSFVYVADSWPGSVLATADKNGGVRIQQYDTLGLYFSPEVLKEFIAWCVQLELLK